MRTSPHPALLALVGALLGALFTVLAADGAVVLFGAAVGALWALHRRAVVRLTGMEERLARLEAPPSEPLVGAAGLAGSGETPSSIAVPPAAAAETPPPAAVPRRIVRRTAEPDAVAVALARAWAFATGGNPLVRVGLLILFVGLGVGLRYAAASGFFPIGARLGVAAAVGAALIGVGWRVRARQPAFGLAVQGGGVAVLYLAIYAAYAVYALLPSTLAVVGMAVVAALCAGLAVAQNAPGLAVLGVAGGFAAPALVGTPAGSHVLLLSYYALLNLGVLGIAWTRGWRSVAVVGFVSTFVTGGWWGGLLYRPEWYASVQPFLVLSFAVYLALAVRFAARTLAAGATPERALAVDGALVFGLPAATFVLQSGLVEHAAFGRAWSAAALAAVYLGAWALVGRKGGLRLLADAFLAVGLVFATLALPLAFARVVFGALWVLEGAALVWTGARQGKAWMRASGLALQAAAAGVLFVGGVLDLDRAFTPATLTGWLVALSLGATAYVLRRWSADVAPWERTAGRAALAFGLVWWAATATTHVSRLLPDALTHVGLVGATAASAFLFLGLGRALAWPGLRASALLAVPVGGLLWAGLTLDGVAPHAHGGLVAWAALLGASVLAVRDAAAGPLRWRTAAFAGLTWLATGVVGHELGSVLPAGSGWDAAAAGAALAVALVAVPRVRGAAAGERALAVWGLASAAALWSVLTPFATDGRTPPLPAVPVLNPLDLATVAVVAALLVAGRAVGERARAAVWAVAGGAALVGLAAVVARAAHAVGGVPYDVDALAASARFQAPLAVVWTLLALGLTVAAGRRQSRAMWVFGASVLALVVAKLFAVDLAQARALEIVGAFVVVGVLVLVVGYRSPLPPPRAAEPVAPTPGGGADSADAGSADGGTDGGAARNPDGA